MLGWRERREGETDEKVKWSFNFFFDNISKKKEIKKNFFYDSYQKQQHIYEQKRVYGLLFDMQIDWKVEGESIVMLEDFLLGKLKKEQKIQTFFLFFRMKNKKRKKKG